MLETVASFREPQEAQMLCDRLAAEGIFAVVDYRLHVGNDWRYSGALGWAKVRALREQLPDAVAVERASRRGEFRSQLQEQFGDLDDIKCPACGSAVFSKRRPIYQALLSALFVPAGIFPPWSWICTCGNCETRFRSGYGLIGKSRFSGFDFQFRAATTSDADAMRELRAAVRGRLNAPSDDLSNFASILFSGGMGWLSHLDGILRGFGIANPATRRIEVCVDPDFERNGIGRALHNPAVDWLFELSNAPVWGCAMPQSKGQKFLYAAGWKLADIEESGEFRFDLKLERWKKWKKKF